MARAVIIRALRQGVPAYNSGDIAQCARIYQSAASELLNDHRGELKPSVLAALENTLETALATAGSLDNEMAWAFRRAFDEQMSAPTATSDVAAVLQAAIRKGVPAFNSGDVAECERIYASAARDVLAGSKLSASERDVLTQALASCERLSSASEKAWALRRGFDRILEGSATSAKPVATADVTPGKSPGKVLFNCTGGGGLSFSSSVVNDTVMGGQSRSQVKVTSQGAVFQGDVTRRGGGGFASVRFRPDDIASLQSSLRSASGLLIKLQCTGCAAWKVQLNEERGWMGPGMQWQADFTAPTTEGTVRVPLASMVPTIYGRPQGSQGLSKEAVGRIADLGFMMSFLSANGAESRQFQQGPFSLTIKSVEVY